jgi:hypothetical protein
MPRLEPVMIATFPDRSNIVMPAAPSGLRRILARAAKETPPAGA